MELARLEKASDVQWILNASVRLKVPVVIFADEALVRDMDDKVLEQATNVATLPGIVGASYVMPDGHWGYGFPIGGVAAFDPDEGVISAGGVGFDISCGVRCLRTGLTAAELGQRYLGAMRAGINCALANRQILTHLTREVLSRFFPRADVRLLYDVLHNTCKEERHFVGGIERALFVHRKGATRAFGPGHPDLPPSLRDVGQPVLIGGTMGTESWVLIGTRESHRLAFGSACHGAGRRMSRHAALREWGGRALKRSFREQGIEIRSIGARGVAEEAPAAYKDVAQVVETAHRAGLARKVARLVPMVCVKW